MKICSLIFLYIYMNEELRDPGLSEDITYWYLTAISDTYYILDQKKAVV